jgi:hypothetical protein
LTLPRPEPGLVINYAFLWSNEAAAGLREGLKDRPCAVVVATQTDPAGDLLVIVAPVTHSPPTDATSAIALPADVKRRLGLDQQPSWIRLDNLNRFAWPGYDIRPIPGRPGEFAYGRLPHALWRRVRDGILQLNERGGPVRVTPR